MNSENFNQVNRSFIGEKLYVKNPVGDEYAVYESVSDYNSRAYLPEYVSKQEAEKDYKALIEIKNGQI
jgi:hypothetical protein